MSGQPKDAVERALVERARQGDAGAIGELFSRYWRAARAAAFGVTGEIGTAEDAAAEAFRQALVGIRTLRNPERFGPWLRTIVVRSARLGAQARRAADAPLEDLAAPEQAPDLAFERVEMAALVQRLVRQLPPGLREAVSLFYFEGYDCEGAARFLGIPAGTFRRRLHQGRQRLRTGIERILKERRSMASERDGDMAGLTRLIGDAEGGDDEALFKALRTALALRPVPDGLFRALVRRSGTAAAGPDSVGDNGVEQSLRATAQAFTRPSSRVADPDHPVGAVAAAIRRALPEFQEWTLDAGEAAVQLLLSQRTPEDRLTFAMPPGFAAGRAGAFLRSTRALVFPRGDGSVRSTYQALQDSADRAAFRSAIHTARLSDVVDLTWMVQGTLDLREVQTLLERLCAAVVPDTPIRFAPHDEPRYRSGLSLHLGEVDAAAATGGVLAPWPGRPQNADAAHLRLFLEPWASRQSGQDINPEPISPFSPQPSPRSSDRGYSW